MTYFGSRYNERSWFRLGGRLFLFGLFLAVAAGMVFYAHHTVGGALQSAARPAAYSDEARASLAVLPEVLVAKVDISEGRRLHTELFAMEPRSLQGSEPTLVVNDPAQLQEAYARSFIPAGTPLLSSQISTRAAVNPVTAKILPGHRAVTVAVDALSGVEGWVDPGARVDVVWSTTVRDHLTVTTIVENALVLSAARVTEDQRIPAHDRRAIPHHVTLLLSIKDAQRVQLAKESGSLSLNLRGDEDHGIAGRETVTLPNMIRSVDRYGLEDREGQVTIGDRTYLLIGGRLKHLPAATEEAEADAKVAVRGSYGAKQ